MTTLEHWPSPPARVEIASGEVHVWLASLDVPADKLSALRSLLNDDELSRADRFLQPQHRVHSAAARGFLRTLLGHCLRVAPQSLEFQFNSFGKPSLAGAFADADLRFNLSHSHGLALFALARGREIGVDIERIRPTFAAERIAERFFAPAESARLRSLPNEQRPQAFFECWTRKEAYVKARGDGLSRRLDSFEVAFGPGMPPAILAAGDEADAARWAVMDLQPPPGFVGALVIARPLPLLRCWRLD